MSWKKELSSWGILLGLVAFLYFSGLLPIIQGALQSAACDRSDEAQYRGA